MTIISPGGRSVVLAMFSQVRVCSGILRRGNGVYFRRTVRIRHIYHYALVAYSTVIPTVTPQRCGAHVTHLAGIVGQGSLTHGVDSIQVDSSRERVCTNIG
jgi:hypothetical protein